MAMSRVPHLATTAAAMLAIAPAIQAAASGPGPAGLTIALTAAPKDTKGPVYRLAAGSSAFTVELTCGKNVPLADQASVLLGGKALELVHSSQANSQSPDWRFPFSEVQQEFSAALASEHLRVMFVETQTVESAGGTLRVREIIVRLGPEARHTPLPDRFVDSLFTIDDKGELVGHALYSGERMIELWRAVRDSTGDREGCQLRHTIAID